MDGVIITKRKVAKKDRLVAQAKIIKYYLIDFILNITALV